MKTFAVSFILFDVILLHFVCLAAIEEILLGVKTFIIIFVAIITYAYSVHAATKWFWLRILVDTSKSIISMERD